MKFIALHLFCIASVLATISTSCSEDKTYFPDTEAQNSESMVSVTLNTTEYETALSTRSIDPGLVDEGTSNVISDLWLIEFNEKGKQIGSPRYFDDPAAMTAVSLLKPDKPRVEYTIVAIANTGNDALRERFTACQEISDLWKITYPFTDENCGFTKSENDAKGRLVMNGSQKLTNETTSLEIDMHRNVAKISVKITNSKTSGVNINKVRLCKIPTRISYADQMIGNDATMAYNATLFNFPYEEWRSETDPGQDTTMNLMFYMPRNMQGTFEESGLAVTKNQYAPLSATYLEILANDANDGTALRYRFYLGKDMVKNFDIEPNFHYSLPITIKSKGNVDLDSRVESFRSKDVMESSNSYILTYDNDNGVVSTVSIPIDRINYFWTHGNITDKYADAYVIHPDTKWVAQVIWQDTNKDIFHFCNHDGSEKLDNEPHFYHGVGANDWMTVKTTGLGSGNVVIGIRLDDADWSETNDGYMWSWHLWISEYDPYPKTKLSNDIYNYEAKLGGYVHRYDSPDWKNQFSAENGIYIMDRNFGALTAEAAPDDVSKYNQYKYSGLYFCFGRKDPMPRINTTLYRYESNNETVKTSINIASTGMVSLENSVKHPNWDLYANDGWLVSPSYTNWSFEGTGWDEWERSPEKGNGKSLFDPTPKGWSLPLTEHCPSKDNFLDMSKISTYDIYFRLDNYGENKNDNYGHFYKSDYQRDKGFATSKGYEGGVIMTNSKQGGNSSKSWCIDRWTTSLYYTSSQTQGRKYQAVTRLVRDPSQD